VPVEAGGRSQVSLCYNYSEDGSTVEDLENKSTIDGNVIDKISIPNPQNNKENISLQELAKQIKSKPKIKEVKIIKRARES